MNMESVVVLEDRENLNDFLEEAELSQYYELFSEILKVTKVSQLKFVQTEDLVQIGLSKPEQRRYKKIYSKYFPNPYILKIRKMLKSNKKRDGQINQESSLPIESLPFIDNNVKVPTKHIISIEDITINKELGMGQFGVVQQGTWTTANQRLQVAIKCLGHERMTSNSTEFLKEAAVMHSIEHPNIVRLYGVVLHLDSLMLVTELAPLRSLLECLREVSLRLNFPVPNLCEFAEQICDGMTYLESKRLIHRDLAARNILVFSKDRVKISDFGLSRALGVGKDYYQTNYNVNLKLPVAWCAPECILFLRFTSASDVWAFGVCLWEMFTYGFQPWAAFSGQQILEAIDAPNCQRLERPECCPEAYYTTMLECWAHDINNRPKFKDLGQKLRSIRPEQVQATVNYQKPKDGRRTSLLEYKSGQIIAVLGKENMTKCALWYGVLPGGACGMFDPNHTKPYIAPEKNVCHVSGTLSPHPMRSSARSLRSSLLRSDVKRHTYTGKRTIQRSMISSPQGEVKHTGHVGLDGAYFGDISFLDPAGCPPRQVVTPYKPSEDLEQVPLINPNSPSHLTGASGTTPYPLLTSSDPNTNIDCDEVDLSCEKSKSLKRTINKTQSETTSSKSILSKVKCATLGRSYKIENGTGAKTEEVHEYHEISDTETKSITDFSQSLLDEMESVFRRNLDVKRRDERERELLKERERDRNMCRDGESSLSCLPVRRQVPDVDQFLRSLPNASFTLSKADRKKTFSNSTMKLMSAHDEKTLETAVALANEITSKSMNDLNGDKKSAQTTSDRKIKFNLTRNGNTSPDMDKEAQGRVERRNFSEEAKTVPDLQSTITAESKMAYTSLIEEPTPPGSIVVTSNKEKKSILKTSALHASQAQKAARVTKAQVHQLQNEAQQQAARASSELGANDYNNVVNVLPLPPRTNLSKLVDKPRHFRKYPLKIEQKPKVVPEPVNKEQAIIYQNTNIQPKKAVVEDQEEDVIDGIAAVQIDTNPFTSAAGPSNANPFDYYCDNSTDVDDNIPLRYLDSDTQSEDENDNAVALVKDCKDHVSVEDLLEFANLKPCGRQRGIESDEVRIMNKVLKQQICPEECLEALELSDWNVHQAIKIVRVKITIGSDVSLEDCHAQLIKYNGDIAKAASFLISAMHTLNAL